MRANSRTNQFTISDPLNCASSFIGLIQLVPIRRQVTRSERGPIAARARQSVSGVNMAATCPVDGSCSCRNVQSLTATCQRAIRKTRRVPGSVTVDAEAKDVVNTSVLSWREIFNTSADFQQ